MAKFAKPADYLGNAMQLGMVAAEANTIIAMRLWGMAGFWAVTDNENARMVTEKMQTAQKVMIDSSHAALTGKRADEVLAAAIKPVRQKTRANSKRLAKRGPKFRQS